MSNENAQGETDYGAHEKSKTQTQSCHVLWIFRWADYVPIRLIRFQLRTGALFQ